MILTITEHTTRAKETVAVVDDFLPEGSANLPAVVLSNQPDPGDQTANDGYTRKFGPEGVVEGVVNNELHGWALLSADAEDPAIVIVSVDGEDIGRATCDHLRPDLERLELRGGRCGFRYLLPPRFLDGQPHAIRCRFDLESTADGILLRNARFAYLSAHASDLAVAAFDSKVTGVVVRGWVHIPGMPSQLNGLLYLNDEYIGTVPATLYRADLARQGVSDGWCGFEYALAPEYADDKEHSLSLRLEPDGRILASRKIKLGTPEKDYTDVDDFYLWSYFHRVSLAPFTEADKRVLSFFECTRRRLNDKFAQRLNDSLPLISVIMPTRNRGNLIERAVISVLSQTYHNLELIVIDDGSEDPTVALLKTFDDNRLKVIALDKARGVSHARNIGLESSRGDHIAYLDSDNWWDDDHLALMFEAMSEKREYDAAYCGQLLYKTGSPRPFAFRAGPFNRQLLENRNYIDLNCYIHKRSLYETYGGFDPQLPKLVDWDLILRYATDCAPLFVEVITSHYLSTHDSITAKVVPNVNWSLDIIRKKASHVLSLDLQSLNVAPTSYGRAVIELPMTEAPPAIGRDGGTSIVIPSYNIPAILTVCVERLVESLKDKSYEIIIVDNGSDGENIPRIEELSQRFNHVQTIYMRANTGFTEAVNTGITTANPEWDVVLLNNDAVVTPGWLDAMYEALDIIPNAGIVGPQQLLLPHDQTMREHNPFAALDHYVDANVSFHHKNYRMVLDSGGFFVEVGFLPFFCVLITREVISRTGLLDADLGPHYRSDRNYCNVVRHYLGLKVVTALKAKVYHLLQRSTEDFRSRSREHSADMFAFSRASSGTRNPWWV